MGSEDGPDALTTIGEVIATPDGTVLVAQPAERMILRVDSLGEVLGQAGRRGGGPGEFERLGRIGWKGDTVYAIDNELQRINYFRADGEFLRTQPWLPASIGRGWFPLGPWALFADGTSATIPAYAIQMLLPGQVDSVPLLKVNPQGQIMDTLALMSHASSQLTLDAGGVPFYTGQPFSHQPLFTFSPSGEGLVIVNREPAEERASASFALIRLSQTGDTIFARSLTYMPEVLETSMIDERLDEIWTSFGGDTAPFSVAQLKAAALLPRFHSPVHAVIIGTDRRVWLRREPTGDTTARWNVADEDGRLIAEIDLPQNFTLRLATESHLYGMLRGSLDVPYLVRYMLVN